MKVVDAMSMTNPPALIEGWGVQTEELIQEGSVGGAAPTTHGVADVYQRYGHMVYNVCLRVTGDLHMAEDATQATFLIFLRKADTLRKHRDRGGWFYQTAEYVARTMLRNETRRRRNELAISESKPHEHSVNENSEWNEIQPHIDGEIARLREIYRAAIIKVYFEGMSQRDAARALKVPEGTLRRRLFSAMQTLRRRLSVRNREVSAMFLAAMLTDHANVAIAPKHLCAKIGVPSTLSPAASRALQLAGSAAKMRFFGAAAAGVVLIGALVAGAIISRGHATSAQVSGNQSSTKANSFIRRTVGPWIIVSELDERRTDELIDHVILTSAKEVQSQLFPHADFRTPVTLYLFKNHENLNRWGKVQGETLLGGSFPELTAHDAFLVHDEPNLEVLDMESGAGFLLARVVYQICHAAAPKAPRWFKDGVAGTYSHDAICAAARLDEYAHDVENGRAIGLKELTAVSDDDYRSDYQRFHRLESAAICFVLWLRCTDRFAAFYDSIQNGHVSMDLDEAEFNVWLKDVCASRRLLFENSGKPFTIDLPNQSESSSDAQGF